MDDRERIEAGKDWIAARRAWIDQRKKRYEAQYDLAPPALNQKRLDDLEIWEFILEINTWELEKFIENLEEQDEEDETLS